ncbi:hypothetical protein [Rhizobium leguminosarum]|uniref:hypothetical protein n=1 Tax=Rhizobium leguminosarum TaxID=384 RepID=UPI000DE3E0D0
MKLLDMTDGVVSDLPFTARGSFEIFGDRSIDGLKLVVMDSRKVFVHQPRLADPRVYLKVDIGSFPDVSTERAKAFARLINAVAAQAVKMGAATTGNHAMPTAAAARPTFADVVEAYLETLPLRKHNKRAASDQRFVRIHLLDRGVNPLIGKPASEVTRADARGLMIRISRRHGPRIAGTALSKLRAMFKWASRPDQRAFGIVGNPFAGLSIARFRARSVRSLKRPTPASAPHVQTQSPT